MNIQKGRSGFFQYTKPKFTLDKERNKIFVTGFGGVKKYFDSEDEYDSYVEKDRKKAHDKFIKSMGTGLSKRLDSKFYKPPGR